MQRLPAWGTGGTWFRRPPRPHHAGKHRHWGLSRCVPPSAQWRLTPAVARTGANVSRGTQRFLLVGASRAPACQHACVRPVSGARHTGTHPMAPSQALSPHSCHTRGRRARVRAAQAAQAVSCFLGVMVLSRLCAITLNVPPTPRLPTRSSQRRAPPRALLQPASHATGRAACFKLRWSASPPPRFTCRFSR